MNSNSQSNNDNQEIDLFQISKMIGRFFETISTKLFKGIIFLKRNLIVITILFIAGLVLGYFADKSVKTYDHSIILKPNFGANDYLYAKIDLINSKIKEGDSIFLKDSLGVNEFKHLKDIKIEPIADVYKFIENKPENFDLIKLLSEDENIKKVILDNTTSKNYAYHIIDFSTSESTTPEKTVKPILYYLNNSDYFKSIQKEYLNNIKLKMTANDSIISQINGVLNSFTSAVNGSQRNDKLIYYNENTQLNDIIETKDKLIKEQGYYRLDLVDSGKIIKNTGSIINIKNTGSINGKRKFILPFVFILVFILVVFFKSFYKNQLEKSKLE